MSGPRISTGTDSKQDYQTPADFMGAVTKRFGSPTFDLAAHAGNHQFDRYYAPAEFVLKVERGKPVDLDALIADVVRAGAEAEEARRTVFEQWSRITGKGKIVVPNRDGGAVAFDALRDESLLRRRWAQDMKGGLGWLNCEFADVDPWADACAWNMREDGVRSLLLTPAVFAGWHTTHVAAVADVYELSGRLCFDGKAPFPKDCRLSHFHPAATGKLSIWDWRRDVIVADWSRRIPELGIAAQRQGRAQDACRPPNACGVDGAAAIPHSENGGNPATGTETRTENGHRGEERRSNVESAMPCEAVTAERDPQLFGSTKQPPQRGEGA